MDFDFRPLFRITFAELSRKYPYSQTQAISRGCVEDKANTKGLGAWLSQSLTFGNLAIAFGACFLRLQKASLGSDSGRCKDVLQDHGVWLLRSLAFGSSAATHERRDCPQAPPHRELNQNQTEILSALLLPDPGRQWVAALYIMIMISNFRETFAKQNFTFAKSKKNFREGFQHNMHGFRN